MAKSHASLLHGTVRLSSLKNCHLCFVGCRWRMIDWKIRAKIRALVVEAKLEVHAEHRANHESDVTRDERARLEKQCWPGLSNSSGNPLKPRCPTVQLQPHSHRGPCSPTYQVTLHSCLAPTTRLNSNIDNHPPSASSVKCLTN